MIDSKPTITFKRLTEASLENIVTHMSEPHLIKHMPLSDPEIIWDEKRAKEFVDDKETYWDKDGLGHWAFFYNGRYVGWGGFQKEGFEWDFGLVLKREHFGLGIHITHKALDFAIKHKRISSVTFLLPPSRKNLGGLERLGAVFVEEVKYADVTFLKYRLQTA